MSDLDIVFRLLDKPSEEWTRDELADALLATVTKLNEVTRSLEEAQERSRNLFAALAFHAKRSNELSLRQNRLYQLAYGIGDPFPANRPKRRGRPRKHDDLRWLYDWWIEARKRYGKLPDMQLLIAGARDELRAAGKRLSQIDSPEFKSQLETKRKLLIEARQQYRSLSEK